MHELPKTIVANIEHFTGRTWLLPTLLDWFEKSDDRMFILTGDPGTGKSMILAWLAGFGPMPVAAEARQQLEELRNWVAAVHFCIAASGSTDPKELARQIAGQLTRKVKGFGNALAASMGDQVQIASEQHVGRVEKGGSVTGIYIANLNLGGLSEELSFNRILRDPLKRLYEDGYDETMLLLVDALDEALTYSGGMNVVQLLAKITDLPAKVRILATTRPDPRVLKCFREVKPFDLISDALPEADDVRLYVSERLAAPELGLDKERRNLLAKRISEAAKGIFLYAYMVLGDLLPQLPNVLDLDTYPLPKGLSGLYHAFLNRELGRVEDRWYEAFKPVLGLIAVAQGEGLTKTQLQQITSKELEQVIRICKQYLAGDLPEGPFRLFHKSFADFLLDDEKNDDYQIDGTSMHRLVADHYWRQRENWSKCDDYGLMFLPRHVKESRNNELLFELVATQGWSTAKRSRFHDPALLLDDLDLAMRTAGELSPPATAVLVRSSAASSQLIGAAPPLIVDTLARTGQLRRARLLAENTTFPLDRCRAMSWLAERSYEQGDPFKGRRCLDDAVAAAERVTGSFGAMAISFCVDAALNINMGERAQILARQALQSMCDSLSRVETNMGSMKMREHEHLLFWTARAARTALGEKGVAEVRAKIRRPSGIWNLDLQLAAVTGNGQQLEELLQEREELGCYLVEKNLALALADAGHIDAAKTLLNSDHWEFFDNIKRMAWACALCGEWDRAFAVVARILHPEEASRALHRIQEAAQVKHLGSVVQRAADLAEQLVAALGTECEVDAQVWGPQRNMWSPEQNWRVEVWAAHILAVAGCIDRALALSEEICRRNLPSIAANSLCYPTPYSAVRRQHVVPQEDVDVEAFWRGLLSVRDLSELPAMCELCDRLERHTGQPAWRDMCQALTAIHCTDPLTARGGWLDALVAAARLGRPEVGAVVRLYALIPWGDWPYTCETELLKALDAGDHIVAWS
jgi:hypothetical protein